MGPLGRLVTTILVAAALVLVTGWFAARTQGGKAFLSEWLGKRTGLDFKVGRTRIGLPYAVVFEDAESVEKAGDGQPMVRAREIRIGWRPWARWAVYVRRASASVETAGGVCRPAFLAGLASVDPMDVHAVSALTAEFRNRITVELDDASVSRLGQDGGYSSAQGVDFVLTPVRIPDRRMYHGRLLVRSYVMADGTSVSGLRREWLAADGVEDMQIRPSRGQEPDAPAPAAAPEPSSLRPAVGSLEGEAL
jgi:hypothetical protein